MTKRRMDVIIIGDSQVGKTSILKQYNTKTFQQNSISTIGVDFINVTYKPEDGTGEVPTKVWDTAGQERFRSLTYKMYKQADAIIMVFAKDKKITYEGVRQWMQSIHTNCGKEIPILLVGNKYDLPSPAVTEE